MKWIFILLLPFQIFAQGSFISANSATDTSGDVFINQDNAGNILCFVSGDEGVGVGVSDGNGFIATLVNQGIIVYSNGDVEIGGNKVTVSGNLIMVGLPTINPCTTSPSGTLWNNSNVLSICP